MAAPGVFRECCFLLGDGLSNLMRQKLQGSIGRNGGAVFDGQSVPPARLWYEVCGHGTSVSSGTGDLRRLLGSERLEVVSTQWVFVCASEGSLLDPFSHPIFQPLRCRIPFPPLSSCRCTVSMYTALERKCVKNMVAILGASYTDNLLRSHNLLVCKYASGPKYETARSWGIPCVTQEWVFACVTAGHLVPHEDFPPPVPQPGAVLSTQCGSQPAKSATSVPARNRNPVSVIQPHQGSRPQMPAAVARAEESSLVSQDRTRSSITSSTFLPQASHDRQTLRHSTNESGPPLPAHCSEEVGSRFQPLAPGRKRPWSSQLGSHEGPAASSAGGPSSGPVVAPRDAQPGQPGSTCDNHQAVTSLRQRDTSQAAVQPLCSNNPLVDGEANAFPSGAAGPFTSAKGSAQDVICGKREGLQALDRDASLSMRTTREALCRERNLNAADEMPGPHLQPGFSQQVTPLAAGRKQYQQPATACARTQQEAVPVAAAAAPAAAFRHSREVSREAQATGVGAGPIHVAHKGTTGQRMQQSGSGADDSAKVIAAIEKIIAKTGRSDGSGQCASSKDGAFPEASAGEGCCHDGPFSVDFKISGPLKPGLSSSNFAFGGAFSLASMRPGTDEEGGESVARDSEDMVALSQAVGYQDENVRLEQLLQEVGQQHRGMQTPAR